MIPFFDLQKLNARIEPQLQDKFQAFLNNGRYILGEEVKSFEDNFAAFCGTKYAVGCANGLEALTLILRAYLQLGELKEGDEVLVPSNTFIASILAVINAGLRPVLVEPNEATFNIDAEGIKTAYSKRVKAVIVVHLYGQMVDMDSVISFCEQKKLLLIEDAAQAHGAKDKNGNRAGNCSDAAAFSFYPAKNLGALGDGGGITTSDTKLFEVLKSMRNYGSSGQYYFERLGFNSRLDEFQASVLNLKLDSLDADNERRRTIAKKYLTEIVNPKIILPNYSGGNDHVFYIFAVRVNDRNNFIQYLKLKLIMPHIHYPKAPHLQTALKEFNFGEFPISESIHDTVVSIPLNPVLTDREVNYIIDVLNTY